MELTSGDGTLANLYFRTMLEAALTPEMLERLRELESFRDYEARFKAKAEAEATTKAKAEAEAWAEARVEAWAEARVEAWAEARVEAKMAEVIAGNLKDFLVLRGDKPTKHAFKTISASRDADELDAWLKRAYQGETSTQLFPEPSPHQP